MIGWTVLFGLPILAVVFWILSEKTMHYDIEFFLGLGAFVLIATSLLAWIAWPIAYMDFQGHIRSHIEIGETLQRARANDWEGFERATLQREVVETNSNLRYYQFMDRYWGPYIPDEIHDIEPVE